MREKDNNLGHLLKELEEVRKDNTKLKDRLDRISGISTAIIYVLDTRGCFTFVNQAVEQMLHFKPQELLGRHFSTIMSSQEFEKVGRQFVLPALSGKTTGVENAPKLFDERRTGERRTKNLEVKLFTKYSDNKKVFAGDVTGMVDVEGSYSKSTKIADKGEGFLGSQGIIFDITKHKQAERERLELQKNLFETQKMDAIGKLAGKVAHDLNNKLGSIIGSAEMLRQDYGLVNKELSVYIETILTASRHAAELSGRLMEFSYKTDDSCQDVDVHKLIGNVLGFIKPTTDDNIVIQKKFASENPTVLGCISQLQSALLNLVVNATDSMCLTGGSLTVATSDVVIEEEIRCQFGFYARAGKYLLVSVQDTGIGIEECIINKVFEPFFTTKGSGRFIGLGLSCVRDCVKYMGGFVRIDSHPGQGADFNIYLPHAPL